MRYPGPLFVCAAAALVGSAFGDPALPGRALAAAAGTLFEAAPFVVVTSAIGRTCLVVRLRPFASLAGCGCNHGPLPGALALAAIAVAALTFGPSIAAIRTIAALALAPFAYARTRRRELESEAGASSGDPFDTLLGVGASAFVTAIVVALLARGGASAHAPVPLLLVAGLGIGAIAPCATAGVAIAAALAHALPATAAGVLATTGLVRLPWNAVRVLDRERSASGAAMALAVALALIVARGPSGLVNPRLLWPIAAGCVLAAATGRAWRTRRRAAPLVPGAMLAMLFAPAATEPYAATATRLADAYSGERLTFVGNANRSGGATTLSRYAITCCRIDASPVSVRLDRRLAVRDGTWVTAAGRLVRGPEGALVLHPASVRTIAAPRDPYLYL